MTRVLGVFGRYKNGKKDSRQKKVRMSDVQAKKTKPSRGRLHNPRRKRRSVRPTAVNEESRQREAVPSTRDLDRRGNCPLSWARAYNRHTTCPQKAIFTEGVVRPGTLRDKMGEEVLEFTPALLESGDVASMVTWDRAV